MQPSRVENIFLSATKKDCDDFRQSLKAVVEGKVAAAKIHLQEHWNDASAKVVDLCRAKLLQQDAYLGLFGHRHGWVPPGFQRSITALEFDWACERWKGHTPPIFILLPVPGSDADKALDAAADNALLDDFPTDSAARSESRRQQKEFIARVKAWACDRFIIHYHDKTDLLIEGSHALKDWNRELLAQAHPGRRAAGLRIPNGELGRIGRAPQLAALSDLLRRMRKSAKPVPAMAVMVHGPQSHGQLALADLLFDWEHWDAYDALDRRGLTALDKPADATTLARWVADCNQTPLEPGLADPVAALAQRLALRLRDTDLVFVLNGLGHAPDRWQQLALNFWQPLVDALARQTTGVPKHRLLLFVVDHASAPVADATLFWPGPATEPALDPRRLLALPELGPLSADQVEAWLAELAQRGCRVPLDEQADIANDATTPDGLPALVYDRLQRRGFYRLDKDDR